MLHNAPHHVANQKKEREVKRTASKEMSGSTCFSPLAFVCDKYRTDTCLFLQHEAENEL